MTTPPTLSARSVWIFSLAAAAILMVTMGARQSVGLFLSPINTATGLGVVSISLSMAIGQFVWGAVQPIAGAVADRWGPGKVLVAGLILLALGTGLTPYAQTASSLHWTLGVLTAAGAGAASFSILFGAVAMQLPPQRRAFASGFINAGGSLGQFIFAPLSQALILSVGWIHALWVLAAASLAAIPLAWPLRRKTVPQAHPLAAPPVPSGPTLWAQVQEALKDRSYLCLHAGFFTCGFHIAFLVTHLPGEVDLCGLPSSVSGTSLAIIGLTNIAGSLAAGILGQRYRMKWLLALMYGTRAVAVLCYLLAPKTELTFYLFAAVLGFTWLATVPPTAGLVGKLFGPRYLATLFGLTLLSHQIGGFLGAWLGGIAVDQQGDYTWMWYADIVLATLAALVNFPIREAKVDRAQPQAA